MALDFGGASVIAGGIVFRLILPGGRAQLIPVIAVGGLACFIAIGGMIVRWR